VIPSNSDIYFVEGRHDRSRRLQVLGTKSMLTVLVTAPNSSQSVSVADMQKSAFGTGGQAVNMASQFTACSAGKLNFTQAALPSSNPNSGQISNGVIQIALNASVVGKNIFSLENQMTTLVQTKLGVSNLKTTFNNVIWCVPEGTTFGEGGSGWIAYAYTPGQFSYYSNSKCPFFLLTQSSMRVCGLC
jgi:surface antigen